jgi:alkylation response protein AidB-like acyl-CoA dehydrogenase
MHLELSDEQELFITSLREWLGERAAASSVRGWLDTGDPIFERLFVAEGWAGVGFAEDLGGQGGGLLELALTARELGRAAAPSAGWLQSVIVVPSLANEAALVRAALESGDVTALAVRADRIPAAVTSVQSRTGRLHGRIPCVLGATRSRRLLVPVAEGEATSLWLVDAADGGVEVHPRPLLDRSRDVADVILDDVAARRLDIDATAALSEIATRAAILVAADALGTAERMLQLAVDYSKQRQQFGRPIGSFQAVKHAAAQMLVTVESSMSIVCYAAQSAEEGLPERATHAAVAKAQVTRGAAEIADSALTLHGAVGYTWDHDLQLFYKRAKLDRVLFGTPTAWNDRIADVLPLLPATG